MQLRYPWTRASFRQWGRPGWIFDTPFFALFERGVENAGSDPMHGVPEGEFRLAEELTVLAGGQKPARLADFHQGGSADNLFDASGFLFLFVGENDVFHGKALPGTTVEKPA